MKKEEVLKPKRTKKTNEPIIIPLPNIEIAIDMPKYWIKNGIAVSHIDYPGLKMRVSEVRKFNKDVSDGTGSKKTTTFIRGVVCTWLDKDSKFQKGTFHTRELLPWKAI